MVWRKKYVFGYYVLEIDKNTQQMFQKHIDPLDIVSRLTQSKQFLKV